MSPKHLHAPAVVLALFASAGFAAEEIPTQPQPAAIAPVADPAAGLPDLDVNRTERDALGSAWFTLESPPATAGAPAVDAARAARRAAFDAVLADQQARVSALADRLAAATGEAARLELQQEISREKQATQRRLLELQLDFATRDGDRARIEQATAALAAWDAPRPVPTPVDRPVPANPER